MKCICYKDKHLNALKRRIKDIIYWIDNDVHGNSKEGFDNISSAIDCFLEGKDEYCNPRQE